MLDQRKFAATLKACMDLYGKALTADVLHLYCAALAKYETEDVIRALEVHLLDPDCGQFAPKPADIVRRIDGGNITKAAAAWAVVAKAIRTVGSYQTVAFDDPLIHHAIDQMGGWVKLCSTPENELPFRAKDFEKLYMGHKQRGIAPTTGPRLIGRTESENKQNGFNAADLALIGNQEKAKLLMSSSPANDSKSISNIAKSIVKKIGA